MRLVDADQAKKLYCDTLIYLKTFQPEEKEAIENFESYQELFNHIIDSLPTINKEDIN